MTVVPWLPHCRFVAVAATVCGCHDVTALQPRRLFHNDFSRARVQFHEIDAARQFDAFLAVDFADEDGLAKHIRDGHLARSLYSEGAVGWIRID